MRWASKRWWQFRFGIALRRIQLGLDEKDTLGEVGPSEVGITSASKGLRRHSTRSTVGGR